MQWVDATLTPEGLSYADRGVLYGDGVWETLAVRQGVPQLLTEHLARLQWGLKALQMPTLDTLALQQAIYQRCQTIQTDAAVLKIIVTRGVGQRGYALPQPTQLTVIITVSNHPNYPSWYTTQGIKLGLCATRLALQPHLAGFKHLNRLEQVLARTEWQADWQEGLLCDSDGYCIEGTMTNLFIVTGEQQLVTPDLSSSGIAGIMRQFVLQQAQTLGISTHIRRLSVVDLLNARQLFLTNSLIGLWPVRSFAQSNYPTQSELLARLQLSILKVI